VAFFRFSRDKRGYEHFYLVEPVTNRKGKSRPRILYWYRTPPNVKVGRPPFDDAMRRAIEAQYPDVTFDWTKIVEAPIPSADAEKWRERRRAERAERAARKANVDVDDESEPSEEPDPAASIDEEPADMELPSLLPVDADAGDLSESASHAPVMGQPSSAESTPATVTSGAAPQVMVDSGRARKRRRRRRGRGHSVTSASATPADAAAESPVEATAEPPIEAPGSTADDHASDDPIGEPSGE